MKTILSAAAALATLAAIGAAPASAATVSKSIVRGPVVVEKVAYRHRHCHWVKRVVWHRGHRHVMTTRVCR